MTPLDKPLRREVQIGDETYTLTIDPDGMKLVSKGKRNGLHTGLHESPARHGHSAATTQGRRTA